MKMSHISKVAVTDLADDANRMLEEGWVLLGVKAETDPRCSGTRSDSPVARRNASQWNGSKAAETKIPTRES